MCLQRIDLTKLLVRSKYWITDLRARQLNSACSWDRQEWGSMHTLTAPHDDLWHHEICFWNSREEIPLRCFSTSIAYRRDVNDTENIPTCNEFFAVNMSEELEQFEASIEEILDKMSKLNAHNSSSSWGSKSKESVWKLLQIKLIATTIKQPLWNTLFFKVISNHEEAASVSKAFWKASNTNLSLCLIFLSHAVQEKENDN